MSRIPTDLVLESGGSINGLENERLSKSYKLSRFEVSECSGCHFLQGNVCTLHTDDGRSHIEGIRERQGNIENTVQALATRGDVPIRPIGINTSQFKFNCVRHFITGTLRLPKAVSSPDRNTSKHRRFQWWKS